MDLVVNNFENTKSMVLIKMTRHDKLIRHIFMCVQYILLVDVEIYIYIKCVASNKY